MAFYSPPPLLFNLRKEQDYNLELFQPCAADCRRATPQKGPCAVVTPPPTPKQRELPPHPSPASVSPLGAAVPQFPPLEGGGVGVAVPQFPP